MYSCDICERAFHTKRTLELHLKSVHENVWHWCELCDKKFGTNYHLERHMRIHTGERPFKCEKCSKSFIMEYHMREHAKIHLGEAGKTHKCQQCAKSFTFASKLKRHMTSHSDEKSLSCKLCDQSFRTTYYLKKHETCKHSDGTWYFCTRCSYKSHHKSHVSRHLSTHQNMVIECNICQKKLQKSSMRGHIKLVHPPVGVSVKIHICVFCEKGFKTVRDLHCHLRTHTKEMPYRCEICEKEFNKSSGKFSHITYHHTLEKSKKCLRCSKLFFTDQDLTRHQLSHK